MVHVFSAICMRVCAIRADLMFLSVHWGPVHTILANRVLEPSPLSVRALRLAHILFLHSCALSRILQTCTICLGLHRTIQHRHPISAQRSAQTSSWTGLGEPYKSPTRTSPRPHSLPPGPESATLATHRALSIYNACRTNAQKAFPPPPPLPRH